MRQWVQRWYKRELERRSGKWKQSTSELELVESAQRFDENGYNPGVESAQLKGYIDVGLDYRNGVHILSGC